MEADSTLQTPIGSPNSDSSDIKCTDIPEPGLELRFEIDRPSEMTPTASPRKSPRADALRNEQRLVAAAREIFENHGIDSSLEEVAKTAGVGIGTLYRHFPTRQDLVEAILEEQMLSLANRAQDLLVAPDAYEAFKTWMIEAFTQGKHYRGQSQCVAVALSKCSDDDKAETTSPCESMRKAGESLLNRAQDQGAIRNDVTIDNVMTMMTAIGWTREQSCGSQTNVLLSVILDGLRVHA